MEVHFTPSGRPADVWVHDAVFGLVDELAETRSMLDGRYDDIKSGKRKLIPGDEAFARLRESEQCPWLQPCISGFALHPEAFTDIDEIASYTAPPAKPETVPRLTPFCAVVYS